MGYYSSMILDIIFPKHCINCSKAGNYLCPDCTSTITRHLQVCFVCRKISPLGKTHSYCQSKTNFDAVIIATQYKDTIKRALVKIKYGLHYDILSELLEKTLSSDKIRLFLEQQPIDYCTEIPMHSFKYKQRGFNQTLLITKWLETKYNIPHQTLLVKIQQTHAQMHLNRNDRLFNLTNTIQLDKNTNLQNKSILLVDDVITTGTTLEESASVLKNHGAQKIIGLVIANG